MPAEWIRGRERLSLQVEGQALFGAAGEVVQMAAERGTIACCRIRIAVVVRRSRDDWRLSPLDGLISPARPRSSSSFSEGCTRL
jgi:hypothetical protein